MSPFRLGLGKKVQRRPAYDPGLADRVKCLRLKMSVAAQHFPISISGDQRHLFNGESSFEKSIGAFVAQIVKI